MSIFVDTSALFAVLDADDSNHTQAKTTWSHLLAQEQELISTNYILVETFALAQRRLGIEAVKTLHEDIAPVMKIEWINALQHSTALSRLLAASNRQISLVDWISFEIMQKLKIESAFAFDSHFQKHGFQCVPADLQNPT